MELRYPSYYKSFHCLAAGCPDSCCKEWAVEIDDASAERYADLPGPLGDRLREAMVQEEGETVLALTPDGRCPMWQEDGLCQIQCQLGEGALCQVCRDFPRLRHDYGTFQELGLELSCPQAARMILSGGPVRWESKILPGDSAPDYPEDEMEILLAGRAESIALLNDRSLSPGHGMAAVLLHSAWMQELLDGQQPAPFDLGAALSAACPEPLGPEALLQFYRELEIMTPQWRERLQIPCPGPWGEELRRLAEYGLYRYYLQAISDGDLLGRVKMALCACLVVKALGADPVETAQLFSKEVENDPENVDALLDAAWSHPAFSVQAILGQLLAP